MLTDSRISRRGTLKETTHNHVKEGPINSVFVMPAEAGIQLIYDFPGFQFAGLRSYLVNLEMMQNIIGSEPSAWLWRS